MPKPAKVRAALPESDPLADLEAWMKVPVSHQTEARWQRVCEFTAAKLSDNSRCHIDPFLLPMA